jgi:multiple sugar transport system permease protein
MPVVIGTVIFNIYPLIHSLILSFTDWDLISAPRFIGLKNYVNMFTKDEFFPMISKNTVIFSLGSVPLGMIAGLILALLVNRDLKGITIFRACYYIPVIASSVAVGMIWKWVYNSEFGLLNSVLKVFGIQGKAWLWDPSTAMLSVIIVSVWKNMGYNMVLFLSGLQNIPEELYEAAEIDGCVKFKKFLYITLPLLSPITFLVLITSIIGSFQVFDLIYIMTGGGPGYSTQVYLYYIWETGFRMFRMGYGSTLAMTLFLFIGILTLVQWYISKYWVYYESK